jgi:hypothetical protein
MVARFSGPRPASVGIAPGNSPHALHAAAIPEDETFQDAWLISEPNTVECLLVAKTEPFPIEYHENDP